MSDQFSAAEFRVNVQMDGTDGLSGLLGSLKSLQESVERLATSTEASYSRMGRAAKDAEALKAAEATKTEGIRQREAARTEAALQRLDAQTAANRAKLTDETVAAQAQANVKSEAEASRHSQRMALLAEQGAQATAAAQARIAEIQARTQSAQLLTAQRVQAELAKVNAAGAREQELVAARAGAAVVAEQAKAQAKQAVLALENQNELAKIDAKGAEKRAAIESAGQKDRAAINLRADRAMELEAERSANRLVAIRKQSLERMAAGSGGFGLGGMGGMLGVIGASVGAQSFISDSIKDAGIYYSLLAANNNDESAARVEQQKMYSIANRRGVDYLKTADQFTGVYAAGRAQGMSNDQMNQGMDGWLSMFQARHIDDTSQKRALYAISEMLSGSRLQTKEAYRQLGSNDIKGLFPEISQFLIANSDGRLKSEADVKASLAGKAGSDGKVYQIDPKAFFQEFSQYLGNKYGPAADEASEKSPQTAINRFKNAIHDLNLELGKSGAIDVFVNMLQGLTKVLKDPAVVAAVHTLGEDVKKWAEAMKPVITGLAQFVSAHEDGVKTMGEVVLGVMALNTAIKLLVSPFIALASSAANLFGMLGGLGEKFLGLGEVIGPLRTAFSGLVSLFGDGLIALLAGFDSRLPAAFGRIGASIATGTANLLSTATGAFGGFFSGLAARLSAMIGGLLGSITAGGVAAAGATVAAVASVPLMAYNANQELHKKQNALDIINSYDPKEVQSAKLTDLMDRKATLQKAENSWSTTSDQKKAIAGAVDLLVDEMKRRSDIGAAKHKSELDSENKRLQSRQNEADAKNAKAQTPLISEAPGKAKKKKGDGGSPDIGADMQDAQADFSNAITHARDLYELEEDKQKQLLRDGKIGFEEYYTNRRTAVEKLYATEKKAAEDRQAADMAAEKEREARAAKAGNARAVAAAQKREQTLATNADTELAKIDMERRKTLEQINEEHNKEAKAYQKMVDAAEKRVDKAHGKLGVGADISDITDKYDEERKQAQERGDQHAIDTLNESQRLDVAHAQYGSIKDDIGTKNDGYDNKIGAIQNQVASGDLSQEDADDQILAIKKEMAQYDLQQLEQAKALNGPVQDQLTINKQILAAKQQLAAQSKLQEEIEKDVANDLGQAIDKVMTGKERPIQAGKQFLMTLSEQIEGKLSNKIADEIVTGLKAGFDQAGGSSNTFTQLENGLINTLKSAFSSISGSSGSSSGGFLSSLVSGIGSLFGLSGGTSDGTTTGTNSYGFTMPTSSGLSLGDASAGLGSLSGISSALSGLSAGGVSSVSNSTTLNMSVATQDLSSFNASQAQIMSGINSRLSMASSRG